MHASWNGCVIGRYGTNKMQVRWTTTVTVLACSNDLPTRERKRHFLPGMRIFASQCAIKWNAGGVHAVG